jgi:osmotically-inducible protein OsmY
MVERGVGYCYDWGEFERGGAMHVTDDELRAGLQAFIDNAVAPASGEVWVAVAGGVVTLTGQVATATQRRAIRDLVSASPGVRHVLYAIEVADRAAIGQPA